VGRGEMGWHKAEDDFLFSRDFCFFKFFPQSISTSCRLLRLFFL
jgi:hypothetical protein